MNSGAEAREFPLELSICGNSLVPSFIPPTNSKKREPERLMLFWNRGETMGILRQLRERLHRFFAVWGHVLIGELLAAGKPATDTRR
jgi:hypothetical protein